VTSSMTPALRVASSERECRPVVGLHLYVRRRGPGRTGLGSRLTLKSVLRRTLVQQMYGNSRPVLATVSFWLIVFVIRPHEGKHRTLPRRHGVTLRHLYSCTDTPDCFKRALKASLFEWASCCRSQHLC